MTLFYYAIRELNEINREILETWKIFENIFIQERFDLSFFTIETKATAYLAWFSAQNTNGQT